MVGSGRANGAATIGQTLSVEVLGGAFGSRRPEAPNGIAPRFEDIGTAIVARRRLRPTRGSPTQPTDRVSELVQRRMVREPRAGGGRKCPTKRRSTRRRAAIQATCCTCSRTAFPVEVHLFQTPSCRCDRFLDLWRIPQGLVAREPAAHPRSRACDSIVSACSCRSSRTRQADSIRKR